MEIKARLNVLLAGLLLFSAPITSSTQGDPFRSLLEKARQEDTRAYYSILESARKGNKRAVATLVTLAREGDIGAQNELGIMFSEAKGVKPNQAKAVYWFRRSAELGYSIGTCNLGLHYGHGWGVRRNVTSMMKYVFAAHALDGLKCNPADFIEYFKPSECQIERGWELAVAWLRAHPDFKNDFDEKPWMDEEGAYPVTVRESAPSMKLPPEPGGKCKPKRRVK